MIGNAAARLAVTAAVVFMTSSEAFVPTGAPIVARRSAIYDESSVRSGVMLPNQRRSNDVCMSLEGDSTREEFGHHTVAALLAGLAAAANFESANAASQNKMRMSSTGSGSRVNKDPVSLLQWGLPINCPAVRSLQEAVEATKYDLFLKNWGRALSDCQKAKGTLSGSKAQLLKTVGSANEAKAKEIMDDIDANITKLQQIVSQREGTGTVAEREKLDAAYPAQLAIVDKVGELEAMMIPDDYGKKLEANIPSEYNGLPRLLGRSVVEFVIVKPKGEKFDVEGKLYDKVQLKMILDGYTAPVTAGTIMDLVDRGYYNGMPITRSDGFVVQTGDPDPEGEVHDFFPSGSSEPRKIPLEIAVKGDDYPMYSITTEDDGRGYASTKLPFQAYGALGMARSEFEADSASCQFFWLLFDSDLTPAGKNLLDGRYAQFGYTIENAELLADVREGDVIKTAKILEGKELWKKSA